MDNILVIGSDGYVAKHLIPKLEKRGYRVFKFAPSNPFG